VNKDGATAVLVYLVGYLFAVLAAFTVISIITRNAESDDISVLAGLSKRSPMLAAALTFSMVSLAGIPPLAGFFGKFLLLKSIIKAGSVSGVHFVLLAVAVIAVVISLYYYFGVIRAIFWSKDVSDHSPIPVPSALAFTLAVCMAGMFLLGVFPRILVDVDADSLNSAVGVFARLP
jgi:NADH-quinone oxidoreductase subunit N